MGEGEFGKVLMATQKATQQMFAMKCLRKEHLLVRGNTSVAQAVTEKQVLQDISARPHPFVVSLHYAFQTDDCLYLLMDFVGGGTSLPAPAPAPLTSPSARTSASSPLPARLRSAPVGPTLPIDSHPGGCPCACPLLPSR